VKALAKERSERRQRKRALRIGRQGDAWSPASESLAAANLGKVRPVPGTSTLEVEGLLLLSKLR
jgi:hypothetical protein